MMHNHITNINIQLVPIATAQHPYAWVDGVISLIASSGLPYQVGPFGTSVEGNYDQVNALVHQINSHLQAQGCEEWLLNIQWQMRNNKPVTMAEKTSKFQ